MGRASMQAVQAISHELAGWQDRSTAVAADFLALANVVAGEPALISALLDGERSAEDKRTLIDRVFGAYGSPSARALLARSVAAKWSDEASFSAGLFEIGIRAVAEFAGNADVITRELVAVGEAIEAHGALELTLSSKLTPVAEKRRILDRVFTDKVSEATRLILDELVNDPERRRLRRLLAWASRTVADQGQRSIARVTSAVPIEGANLERLQRALSVKYGRPVQVATLTDPSVIGGLRIEFGSDVIDDTVAGRLANLHRTLS